MIITISNTNKECVALRTAMHFNKEANRVKAIMETLSCDERTAKRFDWFANSLGAGGAAICWEAIAAAWIVNEAFFYDGVNGYPEDHWPGIGGGDFRLDEETRRLVPVKGE